MDMPAGDAKLPLPRLVLRVAFAGSRKLPEDSAKLAERLAEVLEILGRRLVTIAPGTPGAPEEDYVLARQFYSPEAPVLRLISVWPETGGFGFLKRVEENRDETLGGWVLFRDRIADLKRRKSRCSSRSQGIPLPSPLGPCLPVVAL